MTSLQLKIQQHLGALPAEQVKAAIERWVNTSDMDIEVLEKVLAEYLESIAVIDAAIESDDYREAFPPLTEEEQIQISLKSLAEMQRNGGKSHAEIQAWAQSLPR